MQTLRNSQQPHFPLAGKGVCSISHEGEVYPCGYLPVIAGDLRKQTFRDIWENSEVFHELRDTNNLKSILSSSRSDLMDDRRDVQLVARPRGGAPGDQWGRPPLHGLGQAHVTNVTVSVCARPLTPRL